MTRYDIIHDSGGCCPTPELEECSWGEWVPYSEACKLVAERDAAVERVQALNQALNQHRYDVLRTVAAIIAAAGGEIRVSSLHMIQNYNLSRDDDPTTMDTIYKATLIS